MFFFRFLNFRALFACSIHWAKKQKQCFGPFAIFALKNVVIGFALSVYYAAKFKNRKKTLILKIMML